MVDRLDLGEQRLLGQVALLDLADLLVRPDDLVDEDARMKKIGVKRMIGAAARYGRIGLSVRCCMSRNAQ